MKLTYSNAFLPREPKLCEEISSAALNLLGKLRNTDTDCLGISEYNKAYLDRHYLRNTRWTLQKFSYILVWSLAFTDVSLNDFVFIDYGGGSGILSLLAKELGIGTVIYNDIYDVSCMDAETIGRLMGSQADYYVCGDIECLLSFLRAKSISCNAIASNDVIEHVYDVGKFFERLAEMPGPYLRVIMTTCANPFNPIIRKSLMRKHTDYEYRERQQKKGHKQRDSLRSYLEIRREIISDHGGELSGKEVDQLARVTRGMIESDIIETLRKYLEKGELPETPRHPTNTCDPYTGNWADCLMDIYKLKDVLSEVGFESRILNGCYGASSSAIKRAIGSLLNLLIQIPGKQGIRLAPFITIYGERSI